MVTVEVDVLKRDIFFGKRRNATSCPIARALKRIGFEEVRVNGHSISINKYELYSNDSLTFVRRFDDYHRVKPFKFQIQVPEKVIEEGDIKKSALIKCDRKLNIS